ncbi:MAG: hypothetical protein OJF62_003136 [Pseudolabrys sp.]|jgi:hypothetical protein|nr:hypothetical protein [Pseudolabrys sp.]
MTEFHSRNQRRWMKPNWRLYMRQDAARFMSLSLSGGPGKYTNDVAQGGEFKFDPDQPRVPAGSRDGGQWTALSIDNDITEEFSAKRSPTYCWNQMQIDMMYCSALYPPWRAAACRSQANERYSACLTGKPLPPLPF